MQQKQLKINKQFYQFNSESANHVLAQHKRSKLRLWSDYDDVSHQNWSAVCQHHLMHIQPLSINIIIISPSRRQTTLPMLTRLSGYINLFLNLKRILEFDDSCFPDFRSLFQFQFDKQVPTMLNWNWWCSKVKHATQMHARQSNH